MAPKKGTPKTIQPLNPEDSSPLTTPVKRTPRKSISRGSPSKSTDNESVLFLWLCLRHNGGGNVDYGAVAKELSITKNAAYKRYTKLKAICEAAEAVEKQGQGKENDDSGLESAVEPKGNEEDLDEKDL